jgi:pyruvate/2-oxoglutarate dehydrogenase complex dihydrolipoamide dehydrogenase (E3) component
MSLSQGEPSQDVVLGSGAGGKLLAWHLARSGRRVAVGERRWIDGSCPNINCLPSKNEIWSAKVADLLHHAAQFGIATGSVAVDMAKVRQRKREMVEGLVALHLDLFPRQCRTPRTSRQADGPAGATCSACSCQSAERTLG